MHIRRLLMKSQEWFESSYLMFSLSMLTFPSGNTWTQSPSPNFSIQKSMASWWTPSPRTTGMHLPIIKKYECHLFVKQMSFAANDQRNVLRLRMYFKSKVAGRHKNIDHKNCCSCFFMLLFGRKSHHLPHIPGSSKQLWWFETVISGTFFPRLLNACRIMCLLYTVVLFNHSAK